MKDKQVPEEITDEKEEGLTEQEDAEQPYKPDQPSPSHEIADPADLLVKQRGGGGGEGGGVVHVQISQKRNLPVTVTLTHAGINVKR